LLQSLVVGLLIHQQEVCHRKWEVIKTHLLHLRVSLGLDLRAVVGGVADILSHPSRIPYNNSLSTAILRNLLHLLQKLANQVG
jgi:hypothetical protein